MPKLFSYKPAMTYRGRKFKGLRGYAGKPTHPPLTDFPIVCYILAGAFDAISFIAGDDSRTGTDFYRAGTYVIIAGAVVSLGAIVTGFADYLQSTPKHTQAWRTVNTHMAIMVTVTVIVLVDIAIRLSYGSDGHAELAVVVPSLLAAGLVSLGAAFGGSLVYDYGFNVETAANSPVWEESETDVFPEEK